MQLKDQRQGQAGLQVRQLHRQFARRHRGREQQLATGVAQAVEQVEQRLFPLPVAGQRFQIVQADQLALFEIVEQLRAVLHQIRHRQVHRRLADLLQTQAGCLQQMTAADAFGAPEVDQTLRPAGLWFAQTLDIAQRRGIGAGVVVGERRVIAQTYAERKLHRYHAGPGVSSSSL
ncbi:hypothetical protein D3C81_1439570 [compost metagenome]